MYNVSVETNIASKIDAVFKGALRYPNFVSFYEFKEITKEDDLEREVAAGFMFFGFPLRWKGRGVKFVNQRIEYEQTNGLLKGMHVDWIFKEEGGVTTVRIKSTLKMPFVFGVVVGMLVKRITKRILFDFKKSVSNSK